jgi:hypothetical protein
MKTIPGRRAMRGARLAWVLLGILAPLFGVASAATALEPPGLRLEAGSIARQPIVAVGRDAVIEGEALAGVTAINGSVTVSGSVRGEVTVLGGNLTLAPGASIDGDALVLGGQLVAGRDARISGRAVAYPTVSRAWLTLLEGPSLGLAASSPLVLGAKLGLVAAWLALTLLLFATAGRPIVRTAEEIRLEPLRCFAAGLVGLATIVLTALFFSALLPSLVAAPMLALVVLVALALKLWGMVAVFHGCGRALADLAVRLRSGGRSIRIVQLHAAVLGLLVLGAIKLVPYLGLWAWTAATLVGMGAALRSKFGRFEPWFESSIA